MLDPSEQRLDQRTLNFHLWGTVMQFVNTRVSFLLQYGY